MTVVSATSIRWHFSRLAVACTAAVAVYTGELQPQATPKDAVATLPMGLVDWNHPKLFLSIYEAERGGRRRSVLSGTDETTFSCPSPTVCEPASQQRSHYESLNAEVDLNSRLVITFHRDWIRKEGTRLDIELGITAVVKGANEVRAIEVPSFSVVGKDEEKATARIRSANAILMMIRELQGASLTADTNLVTRLTSGTSSRDSMEFANRFRDNASAYKSVLERLGQDSLFSAVRGVSILINRDPTVLVERSREAFGILTDTTNGSELTLAEIRRVARVLDPLLRLAGELSRTERADSLRNQLTEYFLRSLPDTDLLISQTGAKPGEDIVITITNSPGVGERERRLLVRLRVRQFGLLREVKDGTLLLKRIGVSVSRNKAMLASASDSVLTTGKATSLVLQDRVQFAPAGGTTLGWTVHSRNALVDFLRPGAGVNVSFTKFSETSIALSRNADSTLQRTDAVSDRIDIAAGLIVSLFDGALQATYGANLTAGKPRSYWGLGFSFVEIAQKLGGSEE